MCKVKGRENTSCYKGDVGQGVDGVRFVNPDANMLAMGR